MKTKARSIEKIIDEQIRKWHLMQKEAKAEKAVQRVVTISREPGSGGRVIAEALAETYDRAVFHQEVIHQMAESAKVSKQLMETLDEKHLNTLEDWINSLVNTRHLWPDQYMKHLMRVVLAIGKHGRAVLVGRGANFILAPEERFRVRVVAPLNIRINNVARTYGVSTDDAKSRIVQTESDRHAFIRKYFHQDIADPVNYDLVVNTGALDMDTAVGVIGLAAGLPAEQSRP